MPITPVFCCGFECGVSGSHWTLEAGNAFETTTVRSGARSLKTTNTGTNNCRAQLTLPSASSTLVGRFYFRAASLPPSVRTIAWYGVTTAATTGPAITLGTAGQINASVAGTPGGSSVTISTGVWYCIDFYFNVNTGGNDTCDVQVNGVAVGQATATGLSATSASMCLGIGSTSSIELFFDDVLISQTSADYPLGAGFVNHFVPTADGTHNVAGTADFQRTLTGTDILNATTTAFQLIDDVPLKALTPTEYINMLAPPNATDYVEVILGPASGISTPTTGPRAVEVIALVAQSATGTGNMEIRLNDNGTMGTVYSATGVAGIVAGKYVRANFSDPPSAATVWHALNDGSNGDIRDLRVRLGSPAALDVNPDQYFASVMAEMEFAEISGSQTTVCGQGSYALNGQAVGLLWKHIVGATQGSYLLNGQTVGLNKGQKVAAAQGSFLYTGNDVAIKRIAQDTITQGSYLVNGQSVGLAKGQRTAAGQGSFLLNGQSVNLLWKHQTPIIKGDFALNGQPVGLLFKHITPIGQGSFLLNGQVINLLWKHTTPIVKGDFALNGQAVGLLNKHITSIVKGDFALNGQAVGLKYGHKTAIGQGSYSLNGQAVGLNYVPLNNNTLVAATGMYNVNGQPVGLLFKHITPVGQGSYAFTGQSVGLKFGHNTALGQGSYSLNGQSVGLKNAHRLVPDTGSYLLSGVAASLLWGHLLAISTGYYALTGRPVDLDYSLSLIVHLCPPLISTFTQSTELTSLFTDDGTLTDVVTDPNFTNILTDDGSLTNEFVC